VEFKKFEGKTQYEKPDARQGLMNALKAAIVIAVIIAAAALFRVWMTTEIVQSQTQINTVKSQIADVRAYGSELEIQYNSMTDPAKLEKVARDKLKMESPKEVNHIELR
jgi:cell division protein FtsL